MASEAFSAISPLLQAANVDLLFCGHVHYYLRNMPFDPMTNTVDSASVSADGNTYTDPRFMTTIVSGASGDIEGDDACGSLVAPSLRCTQNYGWGIFSPLNATHAVWNFHSVASDGRGPADFSDSLTNVQSAHARFL